MAAEIRVAVADSYGCLLIGAASPVSEVITEEFGDAIAAS
jgi:hypothetical protein